MTDRSAFLPLVLHKMRSFPLSSNLKLCLSLGKYCRVASCELLCFAICKIDDSAHSGGKFIMLGSIQVLSDELVGKTTGKQRILLPASDDSQ